MTTRERVERGSQQPHTVDAFDSIIGQEQVKRAMRNAIKGAVSRGTRLPHSLFHGPAGTGKTTMGRAVASAVGHKFVELHGTTIKTIQDLRAGITAASGGITLKGETQPPTILELLIDAEDGLLDSRTGAGQKSHRPQIVFVDEIHRLPRIVQENLYAIMDDGQVHLKIVTDALVPLDLPPTCIIGATTDAGLLTQSLRDRFKVNVRMQDYSVSEMVEMGRRYIESEWPGYKIGKRGLVRLVFPARLNPRLLTNMVDSCVDAVSAREDKTITDEVIDDSFYVQGIEKNGLHQIDKTYLKSLLNGPVSLEVLSMHTQVDPLTLRNVIEPFLSRIGAIKRSSKGRELTEQGVRYLNKEYGLQVGK